MQNPWKDSSWHENLCPDEQKDSKWCQQQLASSNLHYISWLFKKKNGVTYCFGCVVWLRCGRGQLMNYYFVFKSINLFFIGLDLNHDFWGRLISMLIEIKALFLWAYIYRSKDGSVGICGRRPSHQPLNSFHLPSIRIPPPSQTPGWDFSKATHFAMVRHSGARGKMRGESLNASLSSPIPYSQHQPAVAMVTPVKERQRICPAPITVHRS